MTSTARLLAAVTVVTLAISLTVSGQVPAMTKQLTMSAPVTEVTVYPYSATVVRAVTLSGGPGQYELTLNSLPREFMLGTLRAYTGEKASVLDVAVRSREVARFSDAQQQAARDEVETIRQDVRRVADEAKVVEAKIRFITQLSSTWSRLAKDRPDVQAAPPTTEQAEAALKFMDHYADLYARQRKIDLEKRSLEIRKKLVEKKLAEADRENTVTENTPTLSIAKFGRLPVEVAVEYRVGNAGWSPAYTLHARDDSATRVELNYFAYLHQKTGEPWSGVRMTFSTAEPTEGVDLPHLEPLYVGQDAEPIVAEACVARFWPPGAQEHRAETGLFGDGSSGGGGSLFEDTDDADKDLDEDEIRENEESFRVSSQSAKTHATFTAATAQTVPSDGTARRILVTHTELEARPHLVAVPRLSSKVYLTAELRNTTELPLLSGTADVYVGGDYLGGMELATVAAGETFTASFGALKAFKVGRKKITMSDKKVGLFRNRRRVDYDMQIRIENLGPEPRQVEIREALPVTQQEGVHVKTSGGAKTEADTPEARKRKEDGITSWLVTVEPGPDHCAVVSYSYSVEWDVNKYFYGAVD